MDYPRGMRSGVFGGLALLVSMGCGASHDAGDGGADGGAAPAVGRECLPASVPSGGYDAREVYLEPSSAQCDTRACIVYQLDGDPRMVDCAGCLTSEEVRARVFCTCRCSTDTGADVCACPSGFSCVDDLITTGGEGTRGGYCVRDGL